MWGREIGAMAGVAVPLHACEHFYIVTEAMTGLSPNLPVLRVLMNAPITKKTLAKFCLGRLNQTQSHGV